MASTTSLLRSAAARRQAIVDQQNKIADMEWNLSAKTADDLAVYRAHYEKNLATANASDSLSYQNKLITATRTFTSKEIQRATINTLEGRGDNTNKLQTMIGLYKAAVDNDDLNLAQSLNLQIDNLQNTIINEQTKALNTATTMYNAGYDNDKQFVADLKAGDAPIFGGYSLNDLNKIYRDNGPTYMAAYVDAISQHTGKPMYSYVDLVQQYAAETLDSITTLAAQYPEGSTEQLKLLSEAYKIQNGDTTFKVPGKGENGSSEISLTYEELNRAKEAQVTGSSPLIASDNVAGGKAGFIKASIQNWQTVINPDGSISVQPVYGQAEAGAKLMSNLPVTDQLGNVQVELTKAGRPISGTYYQTKDGKVIDASGKTIDTNGVDVKDLNLSVQEALKAQNFRINEGGTVDLPTTAPGALAGKKAVGYNVDKNGNVQFAFETVGENGQPSRQLITYDPRTNQYHDASADYALYQQEQQRIKSVAEGNSPVSDVLASSMGSSTVLEQAQTKSAQLEAKLALQQAATPQQTITAQQLNTIKPTQPLSVAQPVAQPKLTVTQAPQQKISIAQPIAQPTLQVATTPITQGLVAPKVSVAAPTSQPTLTVR